MDVQRRNLASDIVAQIDGANVSNAIPDRSTFSPMDTVKHIWHGLIMPDDALGSLHLESSGLVIPSSFKVGHLAQASIAVSALGAAAVDGLRNEQRTPHHVSVPSRHAAVEFASERLYILNGELAASGWGPLGGLHPAADGGHVRIHDAFLHHRSAALAILGLDPTTATRADVSVATQRWRAHDLEAEAMRRGAVIYALRSYPEWDRLPQARAVAAFPIALRRISEHGPNGFPAHMPRGADRCLRGLRVVECSRVIAGPVAGKTLAGHGADVLWVTAPQLPALPVLDYEFARGKRTVQFDLDRDDDRARLRRLVALDCDVFLQTYRPGALATRGFAPADLTALRPGIIAASLSAWGHDGPWRDNRGFDSIVQHASGLNVSEAEHFGDGAPARPLPCQALDHAAGFFLAAGIAAAVYRRAVEGGSWEVQVSLAGVMNYLRSLGQYPEQTGFDCENIQDSPHLDEFRNAKMSGFGMLQAVRHAARIDGKMPGFDHMPKPLGSDRAEWL